MRHLIQFLIRNNHWFFFLLLELVAFLLIVRFNRYHEGLFFTSANQVTSKLFEASSEVTGYLHLQEENEVLLEQNAILQAKVLTLSSAIVDSTWLASITESFPISERDTIIPAKVINNNISQNQNFLTINRGEVDGIRDEMAVMGPGGVVGVIYKTGKHFSIVLPLLSIKSNISCKVQRTNYFGILRWDGKSSRTATLYDLPLHTQVQLGDTIVTSGYSSIFPESCVIGTVEKMHRSVDGLSILLTVELGCNFAILNHIIVIDRYDNKEIKLLESSINQID